MPNYPRYEATEYDDGQNGKYYKVDTIGLSINSKEEISETEFIDMTTIENSIVKCDDDYAAKSKILNEKLVAMKNPKNK